MSCIVTFALCLSSAAADDEYLSGMLRIRIMSATDIKAKTGMYISFYDFVTNSSDTYVYVTIMLAKCIEVYK